ncbi:IclR family transcriptional regulator [Lentzea roselyniae]|uniref:IclR family transcriptional regulator n=1 Tax=Lentzea roselyniae TaxID=531940 RepID=A0ABP7CGR9_9PSEU
MTGIDGESNCLGAVEKAVVVLREIAASASPLSLATLARRASLPKTTVHRLLRTLEAQGVVQRTDAGYEMRENLFTSNRQAPSDLTLRDSVLPAMLTLYNRTRLLVQLMVLDGDRVRCVEQFDGTPNRIGMRAPRGTTWLARSTAAGRVLLARQDSSAELEQARLAGIALDRGATHPEATTVALLVTGPGGMHAAVSVTGPHDAVVRTDLRAALATVAGPLRQRAEDRQIARLRSA